MFGGENRTDGHVQALFFRLGQTDSHRFRRTLGLAVDNISAPFIEQILRTEAKFASIAVFPCRRAQIAERRLTFAGIELRDLTEFQFITFAGVAGEVVQDASTDSFDPAAALRLR